MVSERTLKNITHQPIQLVTYGLMQSSQERLL